MNQSSSGIQDTIHLYRIVVAVENETGLEAWLNLAERLCIPPGEIVLRGMVVIPEDKSLSEGTTQARQWRDAFERVTRDLAIGPINAEVRVDYRPLARILDEMQESPTDLLLVYWAGPMTLTGGLSTDDILRYAPCDVALVSGTAWQDSGPVLLSLRGGPNLSLGLRVAEALAPASTITLFHAADNPRAAPVLSWLMRADPRITRTVTAVSGLAEGVLRESPGYKAIVLGATFHQPQGGVSTVSPVLQTIYQETNVPMVLVRARRPEQVEFHVPYLLRRSEESLSTQVDRWFAENTFHSHEFADLGALLSLKEKQGVTISIGLPALNEEETVELVITTLKRSLMDELPLVDEIVLIDSNSTDRTVEIAQSCGIPVYKHPDILPEVGSYRGKGEALWKSLHVLKGDIIAWIDTDITNIHPRFIYGLLGPLLRRPNVQYVKGFYQRPIKVGDQLQAYGGGRVTELVARPLLNLFYPELSGIIQPLSGEYAGRRAALEAVPFFSGYGVETGLLIDLHERYGLEGIAQTDLEERVHHNQPLVNLSKMSFAIHQVFIGRLEKRYGLYLLDKANRSMKIVEHGPERFALDIVEIADVERPPMLTIPAYREHRQLEA